MLEQQANFRLIITFLTANKEHHLYLMLCALSFKQKHNFAEEMHTHTYTVNRSK